MEQTPATDNLDLARLLGRASRAATRVYRERAQDLGLAPRQAAALLAIVEQPGQTLSSLADQLNADQPTASAIVDRLLSAELVRRETDPIDRRRAMLLPTEKALKLAKGLRLARHASEDQVRSFLGPEDSAELIRLLSRLINGLTLDEAAALRGAGSRQGGRTT